MKPTRSILDPQFKYRNSSQTDVALTWAEARKKLEEEQRKRAEIIRTLPCRKDRNG